MDPIEKREKKQKQEQELKKAQEQERMIKEQDIQVQKKAEAFLRRIRAHQFHPY